MNIRTIFESRDLTKLLEEDVELRNIINVNINDDRSSQIKKFSKLWYKAYRFNEPDSYYVLAFYYLFGIGTEKDLGMFVASLKKAAILKHIKSILLLIKLYLFDVYLKYDEDKIIELLERLFKCVDDGELVKYENHIMFLIYLYQKQEQGKKAALSTVIKYKLVDKVTSSNEIEVFETTFTFPEEFKGELKNQLQRNQKINKIKTKLLKDNYQAIDELLELLNPDAPEDNYQALVDTYNQIKSAKSQKTIEQYRDTIIKIISCITSFKVYSDDE